VGNNKPTLLILYCSFCEKSKQEVAWMIKGKYAAICGECIAESASAIAERVNQSRHPEPTSPTTDQPTENLEPAR
jgi:ATP-dependent protease Clp ATPase subunit